MTAKPQTTAQSLVEMINAAMIDGRTPSAFELARFTQEADKLQQTDAPEAFNIKGMLFGLRGDIARCKENHRKAILLAPRSKIYNFNYFLSLKLLHELPEAIEQGFKTLNLIESPAEAGETSGMLVEVLTSSGHLTEAMALLREYSEDIDAWDTKSGAISYLRRVQNFLQTNGIPVDEIDSIARAYISFLQTRDMPSEGSVTFSEIDEESPALSIFKSINATPEEIVDLNCKLADELAAGGFTSANAARHFTLGFVPSP